MIGAVVLAAGESRRMGCAKQLLDWQGEPLVRYVVRQVLQANFAQVRVVSGAYAEEVAYCLRDLPVEVVFNPEYAAGQSSSVRTGLRNLSLKTNGVAFVLGDQPMVQFETYNQLIACFEAEEPGILIPTYMSKRGNPVLFHRDFFTSLMQIEGDRGGRDLIQQNPDRVQMLEVADAGILIDLDCQKDYQHCLSVIENHDNAKARQTIARNGDDR